MTAEELIIGHYEKTLTAEQESHLAAMVAGSADVRGLFEQHGNIHGLMVDDASRVETTSKLDKVVLGAALGTLAEIAGQGIGFSLLGKVASVVGALAIGGVGIVLYNNATNDDDAAMREQQKQTPATVQQAPPPTTPVDASEDVRGLGIETPADPASTTNASTASPVDRTPLKERPSAASSTRPSTASNTTAPGNNAPALNLDMDNPGATIKNDTIKPKGN